MKNMFENIARCIIADDNNKPTIVSYVVNRVYSELESMDDKNEFDRQLKRFKSHLNSVENFDIELLETYYAQLFDSARLQADIAIIYHFFKDNVGKKIIFPKSGRITTVADVKINPHHNDDFLICTEDGREDFYSAFGYKLLVSKEVYDSLSELEKTFYFDESRFD